jgi:hypothetical protein
MKEDRLFNHVLNDNTELFRQGMKLINQNQDTEEKLKEALSLLESYSDELERMIERDPFYAKFIRYDELAGLQLRHDELLERVKEGRNEQE